MTIARLDWIHWITSAKQLKTRAKRIGDACDMLASGKKRVCCFDQSGYYSKVLQGARSCRFFNWHMTLNTPIIAVAKRSPPHGKTDDLATAQNMVAETPPPCAAGGIQKSQQRLVHLGVLFGPSALKSPDGQKLRAKEPKQVSTLRREKTDDE